MLAGGACASAAGVYLNRMQSDNPHIPDGHSNSSSSRGRSQGNSGAGHGGGGGGGGGRGRKEGLSAASGAAWTLLTTAQKDTAPSKRNREQRQQLEQQQQQQQQQQLQLMGATPTCTLPTKLSKRKARSGGSGGSSGSGANKNSHGHNGVKGAAASHFTDAACLRQRNNSFRGWSRCLSPLQGKGFGNDNSRGRSYRCCWHNAALTRHTSTGCCCSW